MVTLHKLVGGGQELAGGLVIPNVLVIEDPVSVASQNCVGRDRSAGKGRTDGHLQMIDHIGTGCKIIADLQHPSTGLTGHLFRGHSIAVESGGQGGCAGGVGLEHSRSVGLQLNGDPVAMTCLEAVTGGQGLS